MINKDLITPENKKAAIISRVLKIVFLLMWVGASYLTYKLLP